MSAVRKTAKAGLFLFSVLAILVVASGIYLYMNMGGIARQITERIASDALGVPVTLGGMDISLENKKVVVTDIRIANPPGYSKPYAMTIGSVTVAGESFSRELLTFAMIDVDNTNVNLEVTPNGTNLGDMKKNTEKVAQKAGSGAPNPSAGAGKPAAAKGGDMKVIIRTVALTHTQLNPSVTLVQKDLAYVNVPDIRLQGIGEKENGVLAGEAVAQVLGAVLASVNKTANSAGFLQGLSLDSLNEMGVSTLDVFNKNLKENFNEDVDQFKKGVKNLFGGE